VKKTKAKQFNNKLPYMKAGAVSGWPAALWLNEQKKSKSSGTY
jgi:hypothetical protein